MDCLRRLWWDHIQGHTATPPCRLSFERWKCSELRAPRRVMAAWVVAPRRSRGHGAARDRCFASHAGQAPGDERFPSSGPGDKFGLRRLTTPSKARRVSPSMLAGVPPDATLAQQPCPSDAQTRRRARQSSAIKSPPLWRTSAPQDLPRPATPGEASSSLAFSSTSVVSSRATASPPGRGRTRRLRRAS